MLLGRYEVLDRIAVGGMAEIFLARESGLAGFERTVVVKRILPELSQDEGFVDLFLDEARLAARLTHPHIVHIYELGHDGEAYFIAMEHVRGCDLGSLLRAMGGPLPLGDALYITAAVLEGLHFAHTLADDRGRPLGVVHRDIAPKNVLISLAGAVKLVDFGIAKARSKVSVTMPGIVMGTLGYMAPEQASGRAVDRRADIFATGAMLYRMTTGVDAYNARAMGGLARPERPRSLRPEIPERVEAIIVRAMASEPDRRYPTAAEMRREVAATALALGLSADPDLLAGLVRTFAPPEPSASHDLIAPQMGGPTPMTTARSRRAGQGTEPLGSIEPARAEDPEGLDEHRSSELPAAPAAGPGRTTLPGAVLGLEGTRLEVPVPRPPSAGLELPITQESSLAATGEQTSLEIVDEPVRDTLVDAPPGLTRSRTAVEALARIVEVGVDEPTIDESTSVDHDGDDDERTTMPDPLARPDPFGRGERD